MISMMDDKGHQIVDQPITVKREGLALDGFLGIPPTTVGVVLFAHGSGSGGRFSRAQQFRRPPSPARKVATLLSIY